VNGEWWIVRDVELKHKSLQLTSDYSPSTIHYPPSTNSMTDQRLDRGKQWLEKVLTLSGITTTVGTQQPEGSTPANYWLTIDSSSLTPTQKELVIGAQGATIDAIQYLANASLNIHAEADLQAGYTIELDGYRQQRSIELKAIADDAANRVRETGQEVVLQPMSSAERRQLHTFFDGDASYRDLATESRGQEPDRRLIVKLAQVVDGE
jgi:spoIIIJ-associated protein